MAENGKPWEIEQQQEFQHNILSVSFGSLSELSIVPDFWFAFSAGQALAVIHNFEFIHGDLHIEHIFFNSNDGTSTFIDFGAAEMGKITPEKCALDLVPAFLTMETKMFHGFLCGYINTAQVVLDYSYPNFTDQLQEVAGVNIENPVFLTESLTDVAAVLLKFGLELSSVDGKLSVSKGTNGTDENNSPEEIELFQQIMLVLLLADVNYNQLINLVREIAEERNTTNLSNELRSNFLGEDADPETQSSSVFGLIIKNILQEYRKKEPSNEQLIYVYGSIMKIINARFTPEDLESFIDILAGISDSVAKQLHNMDQSAKGTSASIRIAQISLLLLQSVAHDSYKDEYRIALMLSRSNSFKWIRTFLSDESSEGFMTEIAYAGSRVTLFVKVFENSLNEPNPLWSLIWRALRLAKQMIVAIAQAFDNADLLKKTPGSVEQITTYVLNRSASVIRLYCESLIEKGKMDSFEDKRTLALLQCATELYELIDLFKKENFASDIFKQSLKNTIEKLDFGDPFSDFNILLR